MQGECRVRPFEAADAEAVSAMVAALNREEGQNPDTAPDAAGLRAAFLGADATGFLLVAQIEVARDRRRRGVGRALVAGMAAGARARGARFLWWTALPGNPGAHAFYRALGCSDEPLRAFVLADETFNRLLDDAAP